MMKLTQDIASVHKYTWQRGRSGQETNTFDLYHYDILVNEDIKAELRIMSH